MILQNVDSVITTQKFRSQNSIKLLLSAGVSTAFYDYVGKFISFLIGNFIQNATVHYPLLLCISLE